MEVEVDSGVAEDLRGEDTVAVVRSKCELVGLSVVRAVSASVFLESSSLAATASALAATSAAATSVASSSSAATSVASSSAAAASLSSSVAAAAEMSLSVGAGNTAAGAVVIV